MYIVLKKQRKTKLEYDKIAVKVKNKEKTSKIREVTATRDVNT